MSTLEEIERAAEKLPPLDFDALADWIERKRTSILRDHSAFLNGYAPQDEGLYDDAAAG